MKIGIFSPYFMTSGGGERYMLTIAQCLGNTNEVDVFWNNEIEIFTSMKQLSLTKTKIRIVPNVFGGKHNYLKKLFVTKKYDLLFVLSDGSIPKLFSKHAILHFQQPFMNIHGKSLSNQLKLKKFNVILCNSIFTKSFIDKEFNIQSRVLYPPVDVALFQPVKKEKIILSVGRFHPIKNQYEMIKIFIKYRSELHDWKLVLIGGLLSQDQNYFTKLQKQANDLVQFLPNASFDTVKTFYGKSAIYWHGAGFGEDSDKTPERMEHFGISPVEAMASACVPIVFNGGGLPEIITHGKDGFLWNTEEELMKYALQVICNQSIANRIKNNALTKSKEFSKERFCEQLQKILKSM